MGSMEIKSSIVCLQPEASVRRIIWSQESKSPRRSRFVRWILYCNYINIVRQWIYRCGVKQCGK